MCAYCYRESWRHDETRPQPVERVCRACGVKFLGQPRGVWCETCRPTHRKDKARTVKVTKEHPDDLDRRVEAMLQGLAETYPDAGILELVARALEYCDRQVEEAREVRLAAEARLRELDAQGVAGRA
jgi:hypothetical protein